jgi:hypothetical protein
LAGKSSETYLPVALKTKYSKHFRQVPIGKQQIPTGKKHFPVGKQ